MTTPTTVCSLLHLISKRADELESVQSSLKKKFHSNLIAGRSKQEVIDDAKAQLVTALVTVTNDIHALGTNLDDLIAAQEDMTVALHSKIDILTDRVSAIKQQKTDESLNSWRFDRHANKDSKDNGVDNGYYEDVNDADKYESNYIIDRISITDRLGILDEANDDDSSSVLTTRNNIAFKAIDRKANEVDSNVFI